MLALQEGLLFSVPFCRPSVYRGGQGKQSDVWALLDILAVVKDSAPTDFQWVLDTENVSNVKMFGGVSSKQQTVFLNEKENA